MRSILDPVVQLADRFDRAARHQSMLGEHRWLRNLLRKPYHRLINFHGRGAALTFGGCVPIRVPPEFAGREMEQYEPESVQALHSWCKDHDGGLVVDVGCSVGYLCCVALFSNPTVTCLGIDGDIGSLVAARRVCRYAGAERLQLVYGLVSDDTNQENPQMAGAVEATLVVLEKSRATGDPYTTMYACLPQDHLNEDTTPRYRLDQLILQERLLRRPILLKIDVEGAEGIVLKGASRLMERASPTILLSVHPAFLPRYGQTKDEVASLLADHGYAVSVLAVDHEEHWWCERASAIIPSSVVNGP
jgi:FkbM family methyltransferase